MGVVMDYQDFLKCCEGHYFHTMTREEIASTLGCTYQTFMNRIHAIEKMEQDLSQIPKEWFKEDGKQRLIELHQGTR